MIRFIIKCLAKFRAVFVYPHRFKQYGKGTMVLRPLHLDGMQNISLTGKVYVGDLSWLAAVPLTGPESNLTIGDGAVIGHFNHIYATKSIIIEDNVLTADKVYISDNLHSYSNPDVAVIKQPIYQTNPVTIGEGSWLGENVCIIGASVGKHCVIGANAVVTHDIPDYCVAVGAPARVVKKYNFNTQQWEKTE